MSTGKIVDLATHNTSGPINSTHKERLPEQSTATCHMRAFSSTCDGKARALAEEGEDIVINGVLFASADD